jgi:small subunit ribosomal protein S20
MPNIKAAHKWVRQTERRTQQNKELKSRLRTLFKRGVAGETDAGTVERAFDQAAAKGTIHPNKAARKKSRLAKALQKAGESRAVTQRTK